MMKKIQRKVKTPQWKSFLQYISKMLIPVVVLLYLVYKISLWFSKWVKKYVSANEIETNNKLIINQITDAVFYITFGIGVVLILRLLGVSNATIITFMGTTIVAIGIGIQNTIANMCNGIIIALSDNFRLGDTIRFVYPYKVDPIEGKVVDINLIYVKIIEAKTKKYMYIPNSMFSTNLMVNMSRNVR